MHVYMHMHIMAENVHKQSTPSVVRRASIPVMLAIP